MRNKTHEEEDSDSDWDSTSEIHPPPTQNSSKAEDSSKLNLEINLEKSGRGGQRDEEPPFNFKTEVDSSPKYSPDKPPGRRTKGSAYDPTLVRGSAISKRTLHMQTSSPVHYDNPAETESNHAPRATQHKRHLKSMNKHKTSTDLEEGTLSLDVSGGIENKGYIKNEAQNFSLENGEKELAAKYSSPKNVDRLQESPEIHSVPSTPMSLPNDVLHIREPVPSSLKDFDLFVEKGFSYASLPFLCLYIFITHLLKFLLKSILKPLVLDTIFLIFKFFIEPLMKLVFEPILISLKVATETFSDLVINLVTPLIRIIKSFRLVEINVQNRKENNGSYDV